MEWRRLAARGVLRGLASWVVLTGLAGCEKAPDPPYVYGIPAATGDGWTTASAESVGLDPASLEAGANAVVSGTYAGVESMVVVRRGSLVMEAYFGGFDREALHDLRSATKSITSALVGIAIDQGRLAGVEEPAVTLVGRTGLQNPDSRKQAMTVEDLLTMSPGLACNDDDPSSPGNETKMYKERDWVKFVLDLPMVDDPGARWAYCTGGVVVLGEVIARTTGQRADAWARQVLFGPLGIARAEWEFTPAGQVDTGGHIHLRPRDMAKFGWLFRQEGTWNGQRVISADFVSRSTSFQKRTSGGGEYGYLWWRRTANRGTMSIQTYYAIGNGGQQIIVAPEVDIVAVFTGSNYNRSATASYPQGLFDQYVLGAVR